MEKKIDGKLVSEVLYAELNDFISQQEGRKPHLIDVSLGDDLGGKMYANMKKRRLESLLDYTVDSLHYDDISEEELLDMVTRWNADDGIDGVMFQLPLPGKYAKRQREILNNIVAQKDVDGLTDFSLGKLFGGDAFLEPCTPKGIIALLKAYGVDLPGKKVCIINRTNVVGKPLAQMFLNEDATVAICHSKTKDLAEITGWADIVVAALNKQEAIDGQYIKNGAIVIDVGVHKGKDGKTVGDVLYDDVYDKCRLITPAVGAVGPMTICMLAYNTAISRYGDEVANVLEKGIEKAKVKVKSRQ